MRRGPATQDLPVQSFQELDEASLGRRHQHDDATAAFERELAIVEVVAIERDQRAPELSRQTIVLAIARTPQIVVLDHEQHIPRQRRAHERDETRRHVRIHVHPRLSGQLLRVPAKLGCQGAHI